MTNDRLRAPTAAPATRQHRLTPTASGIPIIYQGQQFPSRMALAKHLAPLLGRSVTALEVALCRHSNVERVVRGLVKPSSGKAIPIVYQGRQFPNRAALADHLAPLVGKTRSTLITLLSRHDGDVERAVASFSRRRPITFEGQILPASEGAGGISRSPPASPCQISAPAGFAGHRSALKRERRETEDRFGESPPSPAG